MGNVVPISQIDEVTRQSVARVINGLVALKVAGLNVRMPKEIQISMQVAPDTGINAITRTQTTGPGARTSTQTDSVQVKRTERPQVQSRQEVAKPAETITESGNQANTGSDQQINAYGRLNTTTIEYEI